jgi:Transposase DDE domain
VLAPPFGRAIDDRPIVDPNRSRVYLSCDAPVPRRIGRTKGGLNSKLHAVCDSYGRPLVMLLSKGQMSDYTGASMMLGVMPKAKALLADKGYDADWFRAALAMRGVDACIPLQIQPHSRDSL